MRDLTMRTKTKSLLNKAWKFEAKFPFYLVKDI